MTVTCAPQGRQAPRTKGSHPSGLGLLCTRPCPWRCASTALTLGALASKVPPQAPVATHKVLTALALAHIQGAAVQWAVAAWGTPVSAQVAVHQALGMQVRERPRDLARCGQHGRDVHAAPVGVPLAQLPRVDGLRQRAQRAGLLHQPGLHICLCAHSYISVQPMDLDLVLAPSPRPACPSSRAPATATPPRTPLHTRKTHSKADREPCAAQNRDDARSRAQQAPAVRELHAGRSHTKQRNAAALSRAPAAARMSGLVHAPRDPAGSQQLAVCPRYTSAQEGAHRCARIWTCACVRRSGTP